MATTSFIPSEILQSQSSSICTKLANSDESLLLFAGKLYDKGIISRENKAEVRRTKGYEGADVMIDYVITKLQDGPRLFDTVIALMKEVDLLYMIAIDLEAKAETGLQQGNDESRFGVVSTDGPVYHVPPPTSINRGPKMSPSKILKKHMSSLLEVISDPDKLAIDALNEDLIGKSLQDDVLTTIGLSRYAKASKIVCDFQRQLSVFDESEVFVKFCQVLKKQDDAKLERKAKEMLCEL